MNKYVLSLAVLCAAVTGCGGRSSGALSIPPPAPVSTWAGTYAGALDFKGCPTASPCGGDTVSLTISEAVNASIPGEFSPTITVSGTDTTTHQAITGTGSVLSYGAAPVGAGSESTTGNATLTPGGIIFMSGSGSSQTGPVLIQTISVKSGSVVNGSIVSGAQYFGVLTRQ